MGFPVAQLVKNHLQCRRPGFDPWVGKIPWRREQLPTPIFWPGEFHGLYNPWGQSQTQLSSYNFHVLLQSLSRVKPQCTRSLGSSATTWKSTCQPGTQVLVCDVYYCVAPLTLGCWFVSGGEFIPEHTHSAVWIKSSVGMGSASWGAQGQCSLLLGGPPGF